MAFRSNSNIRSLQTEYEPEYADAASEQELMQIVGGPPPAAPPAPAPFNPAGFDWTQGMQNIGGTIYAPQFESVQLGHGEEGGMYGQGALQGVRRYKEGQTAPGQTFEWVDPATGKVTGTGKFEEQSHGFFGDLWDLTSEAAAELGPILQFTPLGPAVAAINAVNAARTGDVLPAIASVAGFGGYSDVANAAKAASALKNEDYLGAIMPGLSAAGVSDVGGFSAKDIGQAVNVARAIERENPLALLGAASSYLPGPAMPGTTGSEVTEGFFAPGGEGYYEPPQEFMLPETVDPTQFWYPEAPSFFPEFDQPLLTAEPTGPATAMSPMELNQFLEANIEDPATVEALMQQYYPELYPADQIIPVTGKRLPRETFYELPEAPSMQEPIYEQPPTPAPSPAPASAPTPAGAPAPSPAAAPSPAPAPKAQSGFDPNLLFALGAIMGQPQPQKQDPYQVAQIRNLGPMDLLV